MKLKHLLTLAALTIGGGNLWAQNDVTSTYITNADFSSTTGWTQDHSSDFWSLGNGLIGTYAVANDKKSSTDATHLSSENCLGMQCRWQTNYAAFTQTTSSLPAGAYTLTFDVQNTNTSTKSATYENRFKVTVGANTYTDSKKEWMSGSSSWTTHTIEFTVSEASTATISLGYGTGSNNYASGNTPHLYVSHLKLEVFPFATSSDYNALNTAISAVEGKTWGFDADEYAPYNYVEVIQALASAQAIDQNANNSQATVQALTATLNTSMTANAAEVNAIWDPSFEHEYSTSGNVQPIAWTGTTNHNNATDVRWMWNVSSNAGLNATSSKKALFTKYGVHYGQQEGYTLPLNANTYYTVAFVYGGWNDCKKDGYVTMADPSSTNLTLIPSSDLPLDAVDGHNNADSWKNYQAFFKTNAAGNYVLGLRKKDESKQSQYVYGDFVLKTTTLAEATTYYNSVKTSVEGDYDDSAYGGDEKTAFKNALDASMEGKSVAEIMEAAADLQTKHDTYVAAKPNYAEFIVEKNSAIAIGVTTETANAVTMSTKDDLETALQALYVLEDAAATSGYSVNATTLFGSWTTQNMDTKSGEHWSGDASRSYYDRWQNSGFTSSITSTMTLPAGKYVFKVAARAQEGGINGAFNMSVKVGEADAGQKDFVAKSATGYGIEASGVANYSAEGTYANTTGRGWEWRFIGFELNESASVTMTAYAQILANNWVGFSDATLLTTSDNVGVLKNLLEAEITTAAAINTTSNVGDGVFQIPSSAVTTFGDAKTAAQSVYDNTDATSADVSQAIADLQAAEVAYKAALNAPAANTKYYIKVATTSHAKIDNALLLAAGTTSANNPTGYTIQANNAPAVHLSQAFTFTQVSGNTYKISINLDGTTVYLTNGTLNGSAASWKASQIQGTTDAEKAMAFKIEAADIDNTFYIYNAETNSTVACQAGGNIYTEAGNAYFAVSEASEACVSVKIDPNKYATRIFPFTPSAIDGVTFYSCEAAENGELTLEEVENPAANVPYILLASKDVNETLEGWGTAAATEYTAGWLTGEYAEKEISSGYVLQTLNGEQKFYAVDSEAAITVPAYRAYLNASTSGGVKAFGFPGALPTGIETVDNGQLTMGPVYNLAGQRVQKAQRSAQGDASHLKKGLYIVGGKKVLVK